MKPRSFLLNLSIGMLTFAIGFAWFGVYQFFAASSAQNELGKETLEKVESVPTPDRMKQEIDDATSDIFLQAAKDVADNVTADAVTETQNPEDKFRSSLEIEGYYGFLVENPESFGGLRMEIWLGEYDDKRAEWVKGPPRGFIELNQKLYEFDRFHYSNGFLSFSTVKRNGKSFVFNGEYKIKTLNYEDGSEYEDQVLSGKLKKSEGGKILDDAYVEFTWNVGC